MRTTVTHGLAENRAIIYERGESVGANDVTTTAILFGTAQVDPTNLLSEPQA